MSNYLLYVIVLLMVCMSQLLEIYAYLLKGVKTKGVGRQLIGLANWIQYVARIMYVFVLLVLSYMFEVVGLGDEILKVILVSFVISFILSIMLCIVSSFRSMFRVSLIPLTVFTYPSLKNLSIELNNKTTVLNFEFFLSLFSSWLIGLAFVLPFTIAAKFPELRMMATYSGQVLNFIATAIVFSKIEPRIFKELDYEEAENNEVCCAAVSVIITKIIAQFLVAVSVGIVMTI